MSGQPGMRHNPELEEYFHAVGEVLQHGTVLDNNKLAQIGELYNISDELMTKGPMNHKVAKEVFARDGVDVKRLKARTRVLFMDGGLDPDETDLRAMQVKVDRQTFAKSDTTMARIAERRLFPLLDHSTLEVKPGKYDLRSGDSMPIDFDESRLTLFPTNRVAPAPMSGLRYRGYYRRQTTDGDVQDLQVVSFMYHKRTPSGRLESTERLIAWQGIGYGEHPDHAGQPPTWYLVGAQIGTLDRATGELTDDLKPGSIDPKNFSLKCIVDNPISPAILANPARRKAA